MFEPNITYLIYITESASLAIGVDTRKYDLASTSLNPPMILYGQVSSNDIDPDLLEGEVIQASSGNEICGTATVFNSQPVFTLAVDSESICATEEAFQLIYRDKIVDSLSWNNTKAHLITDTDIVPPSRSKPTLFLPNVFGIND